MNLDAARFLLLAKRLTQTNAELLAALRRQDVNAQWIESPELAGPLDTVLARLDVLPTLDGVEDGLWQLRRLQRSGVRVLNTFGTLLTSHDKLATALALVRAGVPHPRTFAINDDSTPLSLGPPFVLKPRFGSWGRDVYLCETRDDLSRRLEELHDRPWFHRHGALVQELIPPQGRDLRLVVARGRVVGAIQRVAAEGEWRTNIALGGHREALPIPPPRAVELGLAAAAAAEGDLVGVDLLPAGDGEYVVIELNGAADFTDAYSLPGSNVFDRVAEALVEPVDEAEGLVAALSPV